MLIRNRKIGIAPAFQWRSVASSSVAFVLCESVWQDGIRDSV